MKIMYIFSIFFLYCLKSTMLNKLDNVTLQPQIHAKKASNYTPVKLTMRQGLLMNQILNVYALDDAENELCQNHSQEFKQALRAFEPWALQMFDSSSKLQAGLLLGNLVEYGSYSQCLKIYAKSEFQQPIIGKYCILKIIPSIDLVQIILKFRNVSEKRFLKIRHMVEKAEIGWSVCIPNSCSTKDIFRHFNKTIKETAQGLNLQLIVDENYCQTIKDNQNNWNWRQYISLAFLLSFVAIGILASILVVYYKNSFLNTFASTKNLEKIMTVKNKDRNGKNFYFINGLRAFSSFSVVTGHRYIMYNMDPVINRLETLDWVTDYTSTLILGSVLSVDSFFMISGMLTTVGFFNYVSKTGKFNLIFYYLHRYIRITAPLAVVLLFHASLAQHLSTGPFIYDIYANHQKHCHDYWWSVLLHVQAYVNPRKLCIYQIWYLSSEMPFYFVSPLILYPLWKWPFFGILNALALITIAIGISFYLAWTKRYPGDMIPITNQLFQMEFFQKYYIAPHVRIAPYIIGILFGFLIYRQQNRNVILNKGLASFFWLLSIITMICTILSTHAFQDENHEYNRWESSLYLSLARSAWTLALVWNVWACHNGYGGILNDFLSAAAFQILGRLSYGAFLLHTLTQLYKSGAGKVSRDFSDFNVVYDAIADITIAFLMSMLFVVFYEMPLLGLERIIFGI